MPAAACGGLLPAAGAVVVVVAAAAAALLRALAHVLDTHWCHINEKIAKRDV